MSRPRGASAGAPPPGPLLKVLSRFIRRALLVGCALLVLFVGALAVVATLYEDEVKARLLGLLNAQLATPVQVEHIDLTLLRRFPKASLHLHGVFVREVRPDSAAADSLLYAEDLFLDFNLSELLTGTYGIRRIHGEGVRAFIAHDAQGRPNYRIWRSDSTATGRLPLQKLTLDDLWVRYRHGGSATEVIGASDRIALRGTLGDGPNTLRTEGHVHLIDWHQGPARILADRQAEVLLTMTFGDADGAFRITNGEVNSGGVRLTSTLAVVPEADGLFLDLRAAGDQCDLERLLALLPVEVTRPLRPYGLKGEADVVARYAGTIGGRTPPALAVQLAVRDGRFREQASGATFDQVHGWADLALTGDGTLAELKVRELRARSAGGALTGHLHLRGGAKAHVDAGLKADMDLGELLRFVRLDSLQHAEGRLRADLTARGPLPRLAGLKARDLGALTIGGTAALRGASIGLRGVGLAITAVDADLALHGPDARVQRLTATVQGDRLDLSGTLHGLVPYLLLDGQRLAITATGSAARIDLARWVTGGGHGPAHLALPAALALDLDVRVDELVYDAFTATGITGRVVLADRVLRAEPVRFTTAGGTVGGAIALDGRSTAAYPLAVRASLGGIDVHRLFAEFKDFGQDFIGQRHLQGTCRAEVRFDAPLRPDLHFDLDRLTCTADVVVEQGVLKGHAPLMEVATYVKRNKLAGLMLDADQLARRLAEVRFARLENRIEIRDRQVRIPLMEVKSSALDIELSGVHGFDDRIDHRLNFRLGDLVRGAPPQDEFGPVVDDGTGPRLFLRMQGLASDPSFSTDPEMAAARRGRQWQQEKQELKALFRKDLEARDERTATAGTVHFQVEHPDDADTPEKAPEPRPERRRGEDDPPPVVFEVEP